MGFSEAQGCLGVLVCDEVETLGCSLCCRGMVMGTFCSSRRRLAGCSGAWYVDVRMRSEFCCPHALFVTCDTALLRVGVQRAEQVPRALGVA